MMEVKVLPTLSSLIMGWVAMAFIILAFIAIPVVIFIRLKRKMNNIENSLNEIKEKLDKNI
jgi:preprotein translocase subunit YajC